MGWTELMEEAAEHVRKSRFSKAIDLYRTALSDAPEDPVLRARLADVYRRDKNNERAFHHFKRASAIYAARGDSVNAVQMIREANAVSPNEPEVLFRLAELSKHVGDLPALDAALRQLVAVAKGKGDRRRVWALGELHALRPDDGAVAEQCAEALAEAERLDDAVGVYLQLALRRAQKPDEALRAVSRAAQLAVERPDLGAQLSAVLLAINRPREALSVLVPFYERYPDHIGVLEALLRALETIGAAHKVVPARIELLKARATHHQYVETMREVEILLRLAPEEPAVLEVCAHACGVFNEKAKASELWRHLAMVADARGMRLERDRAILSLLKTDPDDEQALELGARALEQAGRAAEAATLRARREEVQSIKQRAVVRNRGPHGDAPGSTPVPVAPVAVAPESTRSLTGTMVLGDDDVLEVAEEADDTEEAIEEEEVDVAPELPMMVNPWAQSGGGSLTDAERRAGPADFDEETAEEVVSFPFVDPEQVEGLEGPIKPPAGPLRMGGAAVSSREFQVMSGTRAGPDDVTRIAQNHERLKKSGTPSQPQIQALRAASITATSEDAVPLDEISIAPPTGYIDDPFFAEEDHGADEVTSKMEALVELELRAESVRASRGVTDGRTQPASSLVADLLDDAAPRPKR